MSTFVIYSANENALTGAGYWNDKDGWSVHGNATVYVKKKLDMRLPHSVGGDARWLKEEGKKLLQPISQTLTKGLAKVRRKHVQTAQTRSIQLKPIAATPGSQVAAFQQLQMDLIVS